MIFTSTYHFNIWMYQNLFNQSTVLSTIFFLNNSNRLNGICTKEEKESFLQAEKTKCNQTKIFKVAF